MTLPEPDWHRYVLPNQQPGPGMAPVGDPTRWGVSHDTLIPATGVQDSTQILAIATRDAYSRAWSLFGNLTLPAELWNTGAGVDIALDMVMGVGQAQITQRLALFAGSASGGATTTITALCEAQYLPNGGVYESVTQVVNGIPMQTRSFAAVGALVGQSINIRARYVISGVFASLPTTSNLSLIVAPLAAGDKL